MCLCGDGRDDINELSYYRKNEAPNYLWVDDTARKREREAAASQAAMWYGWAGQQSQGRSRETQRPATSGSKDSYFEPHVASAFVGLPGSDFRAVYDPERRRQPKHPDRQRPSNPPHHTQQRRPDRVVINQPRPMEAMAMGPPRHHYAHDNMRRRPDAVKYPSKTSVPAALKAAPSPMVPSRPKPVRRDSNNISELGSEDGRDGDDLNSYVVSPTSPNAPPAPWESRSLYTRTKHSHGRNGAF
ncbi:hypothetical protein M426DRAFT_162199 [Hypoxylon sp. CI-4A]|nr:hypothetical protein M426DRAFT_162199 [Hypoxylon sp. CI-4A]